MWGRPVGKEKRIAALRMATFPLRISGIQNTPQDLEFLIQVQRETPGLLGQQPKSGSDLQRSRR